MAFLAEPLATILSTCLDHLWDGTTRCMCYPIQVGQSVRKLGEAMARLKETEEDVKERIEREERQQSTRAIHQVEGWLLRVAAIAAQAEALESAYAQRRCPSYNCCSNCWIGMSATNKLRQVEQLQKEQFQQVTAKTLPPPVQEMLARPVSAEMSGMLESNFEEALRYLGDVGDGILGIWGMGGVGKTTLAEQINNHLAQNPSAYDHVMFIVASRACTVQKVQEDIANKLELEMGGDATATIFNFLKARSFVLLLDDLWERLDLKEVGIPLPLGVVDHYKRKVILTTRSKVVCGNMEAHWRLKVECLQPEAAWSLFQDKVGAKVINSHPAIPQLAKKVTGECAGLPLALITTGRAMSSKETPQEWEHALRLLQKSRLPDISGTSREDDPFPLLKFSYDSLDDDRIRKCFLCCSLWPEDCKIAKDEIIKCWMGLDLIDDFDNVDEAYGTGHSILSTLQSSCLLETHYVDRHTFAPPTPCVKMHDVIRDLALWIARDCGKDQSKWMVHAGVGLTKAPQEPSVWNKACVISLMRNRIRELPYTISSDCPNLTTLLLQNNRFCYFETIQFFRKLKYLDLSHSGLSIFPKEICGLVQLQYLNLSSTWISSLPEEMSGLQNLKYLHLRNTWACVPQGLLSKLVNLKVLDVYNAEGRVEDISIIDQIFDCFNNKGCLKALGVNVFIVSDLKRLIELSLSISSLNIHTMKGLTSISFSKAGRHRMQFTFTRRCISEFGYDLDDELVVEPDHHQGLLCLETLTVMGLTSLERIICKGMEPSSGFLPSLRDVTIGACDQLKDATWVVNLPSLEFLRLFECKEMEHVIDEQALGVIDEEKRKATFRCLISLSMSDLPKLCSICDDAFTFPSLRHVELVFCPAILPIPAEIKHKIEDGGRKRHRSTSQNHKGGGGFPRSYPENYGHQVRSDAQRSA